MAEGPCVEARSLGRAPRQDSMAQDVAQARAQALAMLRRVGHDLEPVVDVAVDPELGHMGSTRPLADRFLIVVSEWAVASGMLPTLLVHEMSHIARILGGHPSHDPRVLEAAAAALAPRVRDEAQARTVHDLLNNVQDLYADDVAFEALRRGGAWDEGRIARFFQGWVADEPSGRHAEDAAWRDAWLLANNARALAQLARHRVPDLDGAAAGANARFLARVPPRAAAGFEPLRALLAGLPEDPAPAACVELLRVYLRRFEDVLDAMEEGILVPSGGPRPDRVGGRPDAR